MLKTTQDDNENPKKIPLKESAVKSKNPSIDLYPDLQRIYENQQQFITPTPNNTLRKGEKILNSTNQLDLELLNTSGNPLMETDHQDCYPAIIKAIENSENQKEIEKLHELEKQSK